MKHYKKTFPQAQIVHSHVLQVMAEAFQAFFRRVKKAERVQNPNCYRQAPAKLWVLQRSLARKKQGGKNRRKALLQVQVANQRQDGLHKLSAQLIEPYDLIVLEDLRVRNRVRNKHLSKSILDSGCEPSVRRIFKQYLTYKAGSAGREVVLVDPARTFKTCSTCGVILESLTLKDRWVECVWGLWLNRDHNAAIKILAKARALLCKT